MELMRSLAACHMSVSFETMRMYVQRPRARERFWCFYK